MFLFSVIGLLYDLLEYLKYCRLKIVIGMLKKYILRGLARKPITATQRIYCITKLEDMLRGCPDAKRPSLPDNAMFRSYFSGIKSFGIKFQA